MNRNTAKIKEGLRALSGHTYEIISGTVKPGSINETDLTISVLPSDDGAIIENVMLSSLTDDDNGLILMPKDGSNVVIGSVDGPGEWTLIKAGELKGVRITIGSVKYELDDTKVLIQNGNTVLDISNSLFKIATPAESLFQLLQDLITGLTMLTVGTSAGPSTVPTNIATFTALLTRLNNLLTP